MVHTQAKDADAHEKKQEAPHDVAPGKPSRRHEDRRGRRQRKAEVSRPGPLTSAGRGLQASGPAQGRPAATLRPGAPWAAAVCSQPAPPSLRGRGRIRAAHWLLPDT